MDLLDDIARRSSNVVRAEASAIAETEAALRDLKAGVTLATVTLAHTTARRRWWLGAAAAAAVVGVVATGALVVSRNGEEDVTPNATTPTHALPGFVPMLMTEADAEVLYQAAVGEALDQLGMEDELRPLAPFVMTDGAIVIGDPVNARWLVVREGAASAVPTDDAEFVWDALQAFNGTIYSLVYTWSNKGLVNGRVERSGSEVFEFVEPHPLNVGDCCKRLTYDGAFENLDGGPRLVGDTVTIVESAGAPVVTQAGSATGVQVTARFADGTTASWTVPLVDGSGPELTVMPDGSLVGLQRASSLRTWTVSHLRLDGTVAQSSITLDSEPADNVGKWSIGLDGLTVLTLDPAEEMFRVLRFPLPELLPVDKQQPTEATVVSTEPPSTDGTVPTTVVDTNATLPGRVLYEARRGSGEGRLGLQQCSDCEASGPLAPMIAADGTIILPDRINRRWVTVRGDVTTYVPFAPRTLVYDAVLGSDGHVYWVEFEDGLDYPARPVVRSAPADDLAAAEAIGLPEADGVELCCRTIAFDGSRGPLAGAITVETFDPNRIVVVRDDGAPTINALLLPDGTAVTATAADGTSQTWTLDNPGLVASLPELYPLPDGSGVAIQVSPLSQDARILHTINHLRLDGTVATGNLPPGVTTAGPGGHWSVTPDGVATLIYDEATRMFQVVRYPLPT